MSKDLAERIAATVILLVFMFIAQLYILETFGCY